MRPSTVTPTGVERTFGDDEIIVSKTDPQGRITYANQVFLRIAGYDEEDVISQPHSIVRHPEMPRAVFSLLWETIQAGQEMFAYINNLAADGAHYWVFAHVTPSRARGSLVGYHSSRRSPDRAAVAEVAPLYATLLAAERRHAKHADAIAASRTLLDAHLASHGQTYDEFVWSIGAATTIGARR